LICVAPKRLDLLRLVGDHPRAEQRHLAFDAVERLLDRAKPCPVNSMNDALASGCEAHRADEPM
jgi:hypothetical protein